MFRITTTTMFLGTLLCFSACGDDTEPSPDGGTDAGTIPPDPSLDECTPYSPTPLVQVDTGAWIDAQDEGMSFSLTAPADPGGGFVRVQLAQTDSELSPELRVLADGDASGAIVAGSAAGTADPQTKYAAFAVAPGQVYNIEAKQFVKADPLNYPVSFTLTSTFTSLVDCYEPNDTPAEAKQIPFDELIEAYSVAGYRRNGITAEEFNDWYKVVIASPADAIRAELVRAPPGHRMRIRIWDSTGTTQLGSAGGSAPDELFTSATSNPLDTGTYLVSVEVAQADVADVEDATPEPGHWSQTYQIRVTVER